MSEWTWEAVRMFFAPAVWTWRKVAARVDLWLCAHDRHARPNCLSASSMPPNDGHTWCPKWRGNCLRCGVLVERHNGRWSAVSPEAPHA